MIPTVWQSRKIVASEVRPGVELVIARMTFGRRIELMRMVRDLAARLEYFEAGRDAKNDMEASLVGAEIDRCICAGASMKFAGSKSTALRRPPKR